MVGKSSSFLSDFMESGEVRQVWPVAMPKCDGGTCYRRDGKRGVILCVEDEDGTFGEVFLSGTPLTVANAEFTPDEPVEVTLKGQPGYLILHK
tara:strand:- start:3280 stop:3558 length:279 start_codon:yes stop_codon:yes gene_type:complete